MLINKSISEGHARALIGIEDEKKQLEIAEKIVKNKLSVRDVEKLVKESDKPSKPKKELSEDLEIFYKDIAEKMKQKLGTKVTINAKEDGSGKIEIEFYSNDDLDRIKFLLK
jgi:ParB family chromosome partitioning protein